MRWHHLVALLWLPTYDIADQKRQEENAVYKIKTLPNYLLIFADKKDEKKMQFTKMKNFTKISFNFAEEKKEKKSRTTF